MPHSNPGHTDKGVLPPFLREQEGLMDETERKSLPASMLKTLVPRQWTTTGLGLVAVQREGSQELLQPRQRLNSLGRDFLLFARCNGKVKHPVLPSLQQADR